MDAIEKEIQDKGLTAPRVTPQQIEDVIMHQRFFTAKQGAIMAEADDLKENLPAPNHTYIPRPMPEELGLLTFCVLVLQNGFVVTGESACASPENFDAKLGRKIARENAISKIWPLEGYLLKSKLMEVATSET